MTTRPRRGARQSLSRARRPGVLSLATLAAAIATTSAISPVSAGPTVWSRARDPRISVQDEMVRDAQKAVMRYRRMLKTGGPQVSSLAGLVLRDTKQTLARILASGATDFGVRLLYAEVLRDSNEKDQALEVLTKLLKDEPPAPTRAEALGEQAVLFAMAERREDEILAYTRALAIQPHGYLRSGLLSNRAEALMAVGDVMAAIDGYRSALASLTAVEMFWVGSTTLFGLGVALDRSGNPEAGMESVRLARSYDRTDRRFRDGNWFFSPEYDSHWYWALGGWSCGRSSSSWAARAECYDTAVAEWDLYIESAPENDRYVPLARVRLATVKRERDQLRKDFETDKKKQSKDARPPWEGP